MNNIQNGKNRNPQKPIPGCLGRMVNLFDSNIGVRGIRLLTDKPHRDGSPLSRSQSSGLSASLVDDQMDDEMIASDLRKSSSISKSNGTPIKMLIAQEMSKEDGSKQNPSNLVAKLMGLDALPQQHQTVLASYRNHRRGSRSQSGSMEFLQQEHEIHPYPDPGEYKDVYEVWQQSHKPDYSRYDSQEKANENKMALVREKFMEAKRLSTDEKLRQSTQFQDALEVLSSNKDLFLKFLQEPNSLFSEHSCNLQSIPPPPDSRRITILRPSTLVDNHKINEKQVKETAWDKSSCGFLHSHESFKADDQSHMRPTRIVVLKPSSGKPPDIKVVASPHSSSLRTSHGDEFYGDQEDPEALASTEVAKEMLSSVFSNGYIGDESSFEKSEIDYAGGTLSDSEVISPTSKHSWDYINEFENPYSTSSFSRASCSPESSVCREAKKRLSERWAIMALNGNVQEKRHTRKNSSTLGEMLALSDLNKSIKSKEDTENIEDADNSPRNLLRSKSVPVSSTSSDSLKDKADEINDVIKEKSVKSLSFKGRVSSLFFSKNKKSSKEKSHQAKDEPQSVTIAVYSPRNIGNDASECINDIAFEEEASRKASCQGPSNVGLKQGTILSKAVFSVTKPETPGNPNENQDQPSPISVLEQQFEDDDHTSHSRNSKLNQHGLEPMRYNLIDKSPPIGSISRTLSWDDSTVGPATPYPSSTPLSPEEEEQECFFYVQTLLSAAGLDREVRSNSFSGKWHSPESPLDQSLRDKYMDLSPNEPVVVHEPKLRRQIAIRKLVFDCVNEALTDISSHGPEIRLEDMVMSSMVVGDHVWARIKEWISGEERCVWGGGDGGGVVVEGVVRREVVGRGWAERLRSESENVRKEIEGKLLEELVQEFVLEITGRV